ncbi:hypothetical protein BD324DRAFT_617972 [Kockovaella imperatae]|uniref:FHA domain-containing protein n=1 Tax=Kockovaella imperatae TaxID=4999 RepID=A0A1Y1UPA3_9TREE|nr:hypothetical protein BD324DRAFT_617972 [Kockovaella imperatae]ORX38955.1 hypothetical protein BD324DRAFT_617972 [Kockovaella imperatae]
MSSIVAGPGPETPLPLSPLKQLPTMAPSPSVKRHNDPFLDSASKRSKLSSTPLKMPAIPTRALTPSTSTAAYSSSPRRLDSSPTAANVQPIKHVRIKDIAMEPVTVTPGMAIVFGRHRHTHDANRTTELRSTVPPHLRHLVSDIDSPATVVYLPRFARHASRVHAVVEYLEDNDVLRVVVVGQNGLRLSDGHRILPGQRFDLHREDELEISFYGAAVHLGFPHETRERLFSPESEASSPQSSLPPSSPPLRRGSSPLSEDEISTAAMVLESKPSVSPRIGGPDIDSTLPLPAGTDLPALLASTVVFSGSSKLSLPDLVKHMLESQPSLREQGSESQWEHWCSGVLDKNAMFGKVQRHGKDASGRPLLPHYFYNPDLDTDLSRAKELGGLVRPLRTVQRAGGKAIDWRPVGGGRRR